MAANDYGHVNNLDEMQKAALKDSWIGLIDAISSETLLCPTRVVDSDYGNELFTLIGYDNPDVLLLRWLRARKWDVNAAVQQVIDTLKWRMEWGVQAFLANGESEVSTQESTMGKGYFMGRDKTGRPICYMHAKEHIRGQFPQEATEKLVVLALETCRKLVQAPVETVTVVIDMAGLGMKNIDFQLVKFFTNLLQNYYPELLGLGLVINASWLFYSCWAIVRPWLDPVVVSKIHFLNNEADLAEFIDPSSIPKRLHGSHPDFQYISSTIEDETMLAAFRTDHQGKTIAQAAHREAARNYLNITLRWGYGDDSHSLLAERTKATKQLRDAFEKLSPYISARTLFHRTGDIDEPIFNIAYEKLCGSDEQIVFF